MLSLGVSGTVSDSGWLNCEVFPKYHFLKHAVATFIGRPILILYNGHMSHVFLPLLNWERQHNTILSVLPGHTSHILQRMDDGCFGPFSRAYNNLQHKFMHNHATSSVSRHSMC